MGNTLADILQLRASTQADQLAYTFLRSGVHPDSSLTYSELDQQARVIAASLQNNVQRGARVVLFYPIGIDFIVAFYACLYAGVTAICADPPRNTRTVQRVLNIINECGADLLLTNETVATGKAEILELIRNQGCPVSVSDGATFLRANDHHKFETRDLRADDLAFLQFTSGSTNDPKGVMISQSNLISTLQDLDAGWLHSSQSCMVTWLPFFHDMGLIYGLLQPVFSGFPCYFMAPVYFLQRPMRWLAAIDKYGATHSAAPNFAYQLCADTISKEQVRGLNLSRWEVALNGAEPIRSEVLEQFAEHFSEAGFTQDSFCPGYGMAEASLKITAVPKGRKPVYLKVDADQLALGVVDALPDHVECQNSRVLVGNGGSAIGAHIEIVNPEFNTICDANEVGEIWVASASVGLGYWQREEATKSTFKARLANGDGPFLRTGDMGFVYGDELYVTGRLKDLIVIHGRNHQPEDIEQTVHKSHRDLRSDHGAAFSVEVLGQEQLVVINEVCRTRRNKIDADEVIGAIRESVTMSHDLGPYAILLLRPGSISKTTSGKIQRRLCHDRFLNHDLPVIAHCGRY